MKVRTILVGVGLALALSACGFTPQGDALRQGIAIRGAQAYDEGLNNAEFFMCNAASIGSVKRKYGTSKSKADAYKELCGAGEDADVISSSGGSPNAPAQ